jgi:uncharacterized membrane protein YfcA
VTLLVGGALAAAVALVAGVSGFGFGLLATPLLLLAGFSLPFVVTANLLISVATRVSVAYRLRRSIDPARVALLVAGAVPGLYLGARILTAVDPRPVKIAAGVVTMAGAAALALGDRRGPRVHRRGAPLVAGFAGGVLGTTTSLIGIPPVLLLAGQRLATTSFFADLSVYFVAAGSIGLAILASGGGLSHRALAACALWLPLVLVANVVGTTVGLRLPERRFRLVVLGLAIVAGAVTAATA